MTSVANPSPIEGISDEEWQIRCDLAALYRLVAEFRMTDLIYTHISARVPGPEHHFLINQYGLLFSEMRASDLVKIDMNGNIVDQPNKEKKIVNPAGFTIHSAVHMARSDLKFVLHTHTAAGMAVSCQKDGLLPITQLALKFYGRIAYHGYEGIALNLDERDRLIADLGPHNAMILRNHGLLVGGPTASQTWNWIYFLERACQAQVAALAGNRELVFPPEEVRQTTQKQANPQGYSQHQELAWEACLRMIDSGAIPYRT
ncbi:class II aldolase/adducin family protein [Mesorhizobium sp. LHD-90]|uniref:class II aldolase/adducin family protein n=1 Tax=Mesorhizobium sp. LHD-90 TaxID=3071414 RepID=UPI0027DFA366|nr:class II aldolase/adducin family protein [Mesorhizobium sp. LHD-90]MDQ6432528.1 class II aldolase/adducin family protein [Mesorhizobium sp. LHD-90]